MKQLSDHGIAAAAAALCENRIVRPAVPAAIPSAEYQSSADTRTDSDIFHGLVRR
jgi:hypothetical protein